MGKTKELVDEFKLYSPQNIAHHAQLFKLSLQRQNEYKKQQEAAAIAIDFKPGFHIKWEYELMPVQSTNEILTQQHCVCATCGTRLHSNFLSKTNYLFCAYTNRMHCTKCHQKDKAVIPAQVLNRLNCKKMSVCVDAKRFLDAMHNVSCIEVKMFCADNKKIKRNKRIGKLKQKLFELKQIKKRFGDCQYVGECYQDEIVCDGLLSLKDCVDLLTSNRILDKLDKMLHD